MSGVPLMPSCYLPTVQTPHLFSFVESCLHSSTIHSLVPLSPLAGTPLSLAPESETIFEN